MEAVNMSQLGDVVLRGMNDEIAKHFNADVVFIKSGMHAPLDEQFRIAVENLKAGVSPADEKATLVVVLETGGGFIETVKRMVDVMRRHYQEVFFIIPNFAYSAGTVLALSGDKIFMDYYSILGPIDPQYADDNGESMLPGAGYLAKFEELVDRINRSKAKGPNANRAELAYLIKRFDPAKLFHIEQAIEHGQALIEEWLPKYKFKNWTTTQSAGKPVTLALKKQRAKSIAKTLGDATKWHSHGRGISMDELMHDDIKLLIDDFGADEALSTTIRNYHGMAIDYARQLQLRGFLHTKNGMRRI
ncbi:SDH family Clp fold serine proteinase [Rhizobium sp. SYY.PMSO]|uniref:SDH family Clp fold serine proteinase n=1 Tax=Rhizobium sp. SYY.PMSO TaxID=3382192 RepID=UPI00398FADA0